ncbi:nucleoside triphosphate pyrophosphohydrolase [bacterium]|nr:nucleoside triphosphate pyrophosphohydrolase [bacterium]
MSKHPDFIELVEVVDKLRGENGCPWDKIQTHDSAKPYLIEETYEVIEALEAHDDSALCEELGDVLLQIVFHAKMASERGAFDIDDITKGIVEKLINRHPHVFGESSLETAEQVLQEWEQIKLKEKKAKRGKSSLLDGLPMSMSALLVAQRIQEKASRIGFDWPTIEPVWEKIREEFSELEKAIVSQDIEEIESELGDLLFSITNLARFLEVSSEMALRKTIRKFASRFSHVEKRVKEKGLERPPLEVMDVFWEEAKKMERQN